jgi:hypothetical protein
VGGVNAFWHDKTHTQIKTTESPYAYGRIDLSGAGRKLFSMTLYSNLDYDLAKLLESNRTIQMAAGIQRSSQSQRRI